MNLNMNTSGKDRVKDSFDWSFNRVSSWLSAEAVKQTSSDITNYYEFKGHFIFDTQLYMCTTYSQTNPVYDHLKRLNPETGVQEPQSNT